MLRTLTCTSLFLVMMVATCGTAQAGPEEERPSLYYNCDRIGEDQYHCTGIYTESLAVCLADWYTDRPGPTPMGAYTINNKECYGPQ